MQAPWAEYRLFWREFRRTFQTTGAVLPSGRALSRALTRYVRENGCEKGVRNLLPERSEGCFAEKVPDPFFAFVGRRILEVGPGTGAVTAQIVRSMRPHDRLTLVERNDQFVAHLRDRFRRDPVFQSATGRIELVHAGVEELAEGPPYDLIISGLPLNNFSAVLVEQILAKLGGLLTAGGTLSFFEYIAIRRAKAVISRPAERHRLRQIGRLLDELLATCEIRRERVLANLPPAWVHHVQFVRPVADRQSPIADSR